MLKAVTDLETGETVITDITDEDDFHPIESSGPPLVPTLPAISDRQFFQALASALYDLITEEEAEEAVGTGAIPAVMQAVIDALPDDQRFPVRMLLRGATTFERANPLVAIFGESQGMDAAAIDAFWSFARSL